MAKEGPGSDRAELKKLLKLSSDQPVSMAFALGADGKAVVKLHKMKQPRSLEKGLKDELEGAKNPRFGTVMLDPDDPKRVKFMVNKASGGIARKLVIALKGTGFNKVQIVTDDGETEEHEDEDDTPLDAAADDENDADDEDAGDDDIDVAPSESPRADKGGGDDAPPGPQAAGPDADPDADPAGSAPQDAGALTQDLTALVKQMLGVIKADPTQRAALTQMATDAQVSLKRGDLDQAAAGIDLLREAIADASAPTPDASATPQAATPPPGDAPPPGAAPPGAAPPSGTAQPDVAAQQRLQKSKAVWLATRSKIETDLQKLNKAVLAAADGSDDAAGLQDLLDKVIEPVLDNLDESLSETLDKAASTTDANERQKLVKEAQATLASYQQFIDGNKILSHIDDNPYVPVSLVKTLTATITALSASIR